MLLAFLNASPAAGQDAVLRGFVTDESTGQSLPNANVMLHEAGVIMAATVTDEDGFYQIQRIDAGTYALRVSFVGYETHTDSLHLEPGIHTVSVELTPGTTEIEGVIIEDYRERPVEEAEAGLRRIRPSDIAQIPTPGAGSDLAGYLSSLPGVVTLGDRGGQFYVRGGTPSQNLVLVDGIPVYKPFHILGAYSAFPTDLVSNADFYAGGFDARYMGRISSVLDVSLRGGSTRRYRGRAAAGPIVASVRAEGPLLLNHTSFLTHFRQSLVEHTAPTLLGEAAPYKFYDFTAKVHSQSQRAVCSFLGLRTYDRGRIDPEQASTFRWTNTTFGTQCKAFGEQSAQFYDFSTGVTHFGNTVHTTDDTRRHAYTWRIHTKFNLTQPVSWGTVNFGMFTNASRYILDLEEAFVGIRSDKELVLAGGGHIGTRWDPVQGFELQPTLGLHFIPSLQNSAAISLDPRLRLSWQPGGTDRSKLTAAVGLYRQPAEGITDERDAGSAFVAWQPVREEMLRAMHFLLGWDQRLGRGLTASVEAYHKQLRAIPVPRWTPIVRFNTSLAHADGTVHGVDLTLEYGRGPVDLRTSYGWSRTEYRAARDDLGAWGGGTIARYPPPHDQRHVVGLVTRVDAGPFETSLRWQFSSGLPFTQVYGFDTLLDMRGLRETPRRNIGSPRMFYDRPYGARLPAYHRLDVSVERTFPLTPTTDLTAEAGAINTYDRANPFYIDVYTLQRVDQLPLMPYLSLRIDLD